jgi:hypothetical protein
MEKQKSKKKLRKTISLKELYDLINNTPNKDMFNETDKEKK